MDWEMDREKVHQTVIKRYSDIVKSGVISCSSGCGETGPPISLENLGKALDYTDEDLSSAPGEVEKILSDNGFKKISITYKPNSKEIINSWNVADGAGEMVFSGYIQAVK